MTQDMQEMTRTDTSPEQAAATASERLTVMLVDDHFLVRLGIQSVVERQCGHDVIAQAGDGKHAIELARELHPQVVLMDINMPVMNGIDATRVIKKEMPEVTVIAVTMYSDEATRQAMIDAGASRYVDKTVLGPELCGTIREAVTHSHSGN